MPFTFTFRNKNHLNLFFDPELADNHSTHGDFLTRLRAAGMLRFWASHKIYGALGIVFVRKKDDSYASFF